jgi:Smg protein
MFDVLVYLYENYWRPDACPSHLQLSRKLSAVGFESDESCTGQQADASVRLYTEHERELLGDESIGFISFLESAGVLPPPMREMVVDRATAIGDGPMELDDLKIIVLMVFWSLGEEPDALILDELFVAPEERIVH